MTDDAAVLEGWLLPKSRGKATRAEAGEVGDERGARDDEVSKKELLELTGLSYGQLYRWKRMGLIPEHWFVRRATFTGQETFFPRRHILERIETIQRLKDRYSLEEIAELLSPASSGRRYPLHEVERLNLCPPEGLSILAAVYKSAGRQKKKLKPELQALLAPPGSQPLSPGSPSPDTPAGLSDSTSPSSPSEPSTQPTSYSFLDLVAGTLAVELLRRGLSPSAMHGGVETLLAGASQFSTLDDVHLVCAETGDPPAEFCVLYSGLEPVVFGHGVHVTADIAVGPIAESLRQSLQSRFE